MAEDKQFIQGLGEYIRQGEPQEQERVRTWQSAICQLEFDGLKTSPYLLESARKHIEGDISISEVKPLIEIYYLFQMGYKEAEYKRGEEVDKGTTLAHTIDPAKSELYGGQQATYVVPYTICDHIADFRLAWAHFEKIFNKQ